MRECSWRLAEKEYLATSPLWKIHASAELCSPRRVGNAQRVAPPHESGSEMCDLPSCGWNVFFACVCVSHTTPCCLSAYALSFFYCASLQKYPLFSPVTSRAGLVEQGGKPFNSVPVQVSKTFSLIPCPNHSLN